jgi:hypothetical protein
MTTAVDTNIPITFLRECFRIASGRLYWRSRPRHHFDSDQAWNIFNMKYAGLIAGSPNNTGYLQITLRFGGSHYHILVHRILFTLKNNRWPVDQIDHKSRIKRNNQNSNLREATQSLNSQNAKLRCDNTSGVKGVSKDARLGKWRARLKLDSRTVLNKRYDTKDEAIAARKAAEKLYHPYAAP